ncbi:MAG TPA: hypothetical protein VMV18_15945 [bacterium]|nr:hypothetical protein [bacterium]
MNKSIVAATAATLAIAAAACGGNSSTGSPANGGYTLSSGNYAYTATTAPVNTCWAPPKTTITLPMTIDVTLAVTGNSILITGSAGGQTASFNATRTGDNLSGSTDSTIDLNNASTPVDCVLAIHGTLDGTMTGNDAFDATNDIQISEATGHPNTGCSLLIGNTIDQQVDALPCELKLAGHAVKQ